MPRVNASSAWFGASPVSKDGFVIFNGDFLAESSGNNRHRRATLEELKAHFNSGNVRDHYGHWFEAQLIHYGLKRSRSKAVARMRLFDAVKDGNLEVPEYIAKIERDLRRQWDRLDEQTREPGNWMTTTSNFGTGAKRKQPDNSDINMSTNTNIPGAEPHKKRFKIGVSLTNKSTSYHESGIRDRAIRDQPYCTPRSITFAEREISTGSPVVDDLVPGFTSLVQRERTTRRSGASASHRHFHQRREGADSTYDQAPLYKGKREKLNPLGTLGHVYDASVCYYIARPSIKRKRPLSSY